MTEHSAESDAPRRVVHEPHCNTECRPNRHYLTSGVGMPHLHQTDLGRECGQCVMHADEYDAEPQACHECGKSARACGRSGNFCCAACSQTRFRTHYPTPPAPAHALTEYGTTDCPVERVRANVDDGECSACGGYVTSPGQGNVDV